MANLITALKQIGDYVIEKADKSFLEHIIEDPNDNGKYNTVLLILFKQEGDDIVFHDVKMEEYTRQKLDKYAYQSGHSRGGDFTPTSKVTVLERTFKNIQYPLKKVSKKLKGNTQEEKEVITIYKLFQDEETANQIYKKLEDKEFNDNAILTIGLKKDNDLKYVGDFEIFTEQLKEKYEQKFYFRKSYRKAEREAVGENNTCYICGENADKTYGYVSIFPFYTLDKIGFTSGGFKRGEAWKNYPVCSDCAFSLDQGRRYLEEYLSARFCGIYYFMIPKTIFGTNEESKEDMFTVFNDLEEKVKFSLKKENREKLTSSDEDLFTIMKDFNNYLNFNLLFYQEEQSGKVFRILLYIEDVLPSYISKIFEVKDKIEEDSLYHGLRGKEGKLFKLKFSFKHIADFFPISEHEKSFLEITNGIFAQKKISYKLLIKRFVEVLQDRFRQDKGMSYINLKAFMILQFLYELRLLQGRREGTVKMEFKRGKYNEDIKLFLEKYSDFFDSDIKRALFLEGVLAKCLIDIQFSDSQGESTPFKARLNGLKINENIAKRLLPEIQNKLEEYDKNYYRNLEKTISQYMLVADFNKISNTEMSFYFTTGMNLAHLFKSKEEE